jgi:hypothetical protein
MPYVAASGLKPQQDGQRPEEVDQGVHEGAAVEYFQYFFYVGFYLDCRSGNLGFMCGVKDGVYYTAEVFVLLCLACLVMGRRRTGTLFAELFRGIQREASGGDE